MSTLPADAGALPGGPAPQGGAPGPPPGFVPARPPRLWRVRRFIASLNPVRLFFGPVFQREVRVTGRRKGTYAIRFFVLAVPTLFVALQFVSRVWDSSRYGYTPSVAARIQSIQDLAFGVASTVAWCQLITLAMVAPLLTAGAVVEERTARTLSAVATSPLSPGRVIGGLFASRLTTLAILALLPLPLLLAIRTFGGLDSSFVLWSFAVAVCSAVATAAAGLWASTRVSRTAAGISMAVMLMLLQWAGPPLVVMLDSALHGWGPPSTLAPLIVSPPAALVLIHFPPGGVAFGFTSGEAVAVNCAISLLIAAAALTLARWQLARLIATDRVELVKQPTRRDKRRAARARGAAGVDDATPAQGSSRTVTGNPVLWREMRQPLFNRAWLRWVNGAFMLVLLAGIHLATLNSFFFDREALVVTPAVIGLVVLILSAAAVPAGSVTSEREAQTWGTLLSSPLSPLQILLPKVAGAMRRLWYVPAFITAHLALCVARGITSPMVLPFVLLHMAVVAAFLCITGVFLSLWCRKTSAASALNLVLAVGLWMLTPIFAGIIFEIAGFGGNEWFARGYYFTHPMVTFVTGLLGLSSRGGVSGFDMPGGRASALEFAVGWLLSLALYTGAAGLVLAFARARFHKLSTSRL